VAKLTLKKQSEPPSATAENEDLSFRPIFIKSPPPRRRSWLTVLLLILFVLAGVMTGGAYLQYSEGLNNRRLNVLFARDGAQLVGQVFSSLDGHEIDLLARAKAFTQLAESHATPGAVGAPIAAKAIELGSLLMTASQTRGNYIVTRNRILSAPPGVMDRHDPDAKRDEQDRRLSFMLDQSVNHPWNKFINDQKSRALYLVGEIERMEAAFESPPVGWARWVAFLQHIWTNDSTLLSVKYYLGVQEPQPLVSPQPCLTCLDKKRIVCSSCRGRGSVSQSTSEACEQCKGTGRYARKLSKSTAACPFCNGQGNISRSASQTCLTCNGSGVVRCSACARIAAP